MLGFGIVCFGIVGFVFHKQMMGLESLLVVKDQDKNLYWVFGRMVVNIVLRFYFLECFGQTFYERTVRALFFTV